MKIANFVSLAATFEGDLSALLRQARTWRGLIRQSAAI